MKWLCAPEGSRTPNLLIRSQMLYPVKLQVPFSPKRNANIGFYSFETKVYSLIPRYPESHTILFECRVVILS